MPLIIHLVQLLLVICEKLVKCKNLTVGKPTGKAVDMQNVWDITETVMEERVVEEIPLNTWEQVP